jgi:hypothetical protein
MAGKFTFKLRVKQIDFNFQRSKGDVFTSGSDTDWLTLVVKYASNGSHQHHHSERQRLPTWRRDQEWGHPHNL